jgi:hypothetical protein
MVSFGGDFQRQLEETTREDNAGIEANNQVALENHKNFVKNEEGQDKSNEEMQGGITSMSEIQKVKKFSDMYKSVSSGEKSIGDLMREEGTIGDYGIKGAGKVVNGIQNLVPAAKRSGLLGQRAQSQQLFQDYADRRPQETETIDEVRGDEGAAATTANEGAEANNAAQAGERAGVAEGAASDVVGGAEDLERAGAGLAERAGTSAAKIAEEGLAKTAGKAALGFAGKALGNIGGAIDVVKDFEEVSKTGDIRDFFKGSGGSVTDQIGDGMQVVGGLMDLTGIGAPIGALLSGVGGVVQEIGNAEDDKDKEKNDDNDKPPQQTFVGSANIGALGGIASAQVNPMKMISGSGTF